MARRRATAARSVVVLAAALIAVISAQVNAFSISASPRHPFTTSSITLSKKSPSTWTRSTITCNNGRRYASLAPPDASTIATLPDLFPSLSSTITSLGFFAPTPIQAASAERALSGENLLLIAPTGSGKTLSYFLPAVTKAMDEDGTILVVAPTRELAVQLMRDAVALLSGITDDAESCVRLAVNGVEMPTSNELGQATILIGTPQQLYDTLSLVDGGMGFLAGDTLSAVILDEVDVLLPPAPKHLRSALDSVKKDGRRARSEGQDERRKKEQKRKLLAAKRRGMQMDDNKRIISDTERILGLVASNRMMGEEETAPAQVLAGSATASRKALDRLNRALRTSANGASIPFDLTWTGDVKMCRPAATLDSGSGDDETKVTSVTKEEDQHTIRAVTVPTEVEHRYVELSKEAASSPNNVLAAVAKAAHKLNPETALIFLCGEFSKPNVKAKAMAKPEVRGATSRARRNATRKQRENAAKALFKQQKNGKKKTAEAPGLSARKACKMLNDFGIDALPLHVALGFELNAKEGDDRVDTPPFLVTFEGSARGLHFDDVDAVFVVGRPSSAAAYLHLAGRVGRSSADESGNVVVRPGTVVSVCTKGSAGELEKWTKQIGGTELKELT
uniref:ATP-dependent RNA helicase n=1 Tax=Odontella aurita TaxID=265563 RepID=A0A7S4N898_9STRA|eukprot:CAMPEP_0113543182 /NCGR_PEP_ID=MMETSP0015_2-20120614/10020_1 /TAXON_ID=2838 /ORGANISM="Odontella" /LENGTH=620 /DNA_ID=CAMNT_0000443321 /DNA_START=24 /DNA_END=1886 /DNA_ORIENTATION=+ /assembly_acc=CAM_ASM_000160